MRPLLLSLGAAGLDFHAEREPVVARGLGYRSFLTTARGANRDKPAPMHVTRDHTLAAWDASQLRYFFSR